MAKHPNKFYGLRSAASLDDAQAAFLPADFLSASSYSASTQGSYATGSAVSREVVLDAIALMDKKCDDVARTDAWSSDRRFTEAVFAFVDGPGKGKKYIFIPYCGLSTQGSSSIDKRLWEKFNDNVLISRFWRTCAFIASEKPGGMEAHVRIFNYATLTRPLMDALFLHAGDAYATTMEFHLDIEALFGGAVLGGRLADGGLNAGALGSGVLDDGLADFDFSRGFGRRAYAILDTSAVRGRVSREQVEKRPAFSVFKDDVRMLEKLDDLHKLMIGKKTSVNVLARRDANSVGDRVPTKKQITAGEFARWLNAGGGRARAAERDRLREMEDSEMTHAEREKLKKMAPFGGDKQAHLDALAAGGVPVAGRVVDADKESAWREALLDGAAAVGVPIAGRVVDADKESAWRDALAAGGVPVAGRVVDADKENAWRKAKMDGLAAVGVPVAGHVVDQDKVNAWRNSIRASPAKAIAAFLEGKFPFRATLTHASTGESMVFTIVSTRADANVFRIAFRRRGEGGHSLVGLLWDKMSLGERPTFTPLLPASNEDDPRRLSPVVKSHDTRLLFKVEIVEAFIEAGFSWKVEPVPVTERMIEDHRATKLQKRRERRQR